MHNRHAINALNLNTRPAAAAETAGLRGRLRDELASVRALESRADAKAGVLLSLCSGLLVATTTLLAAGKIGGPAAYAMIVAGIMFAGAVGSLAAALRPRLGGNVGFVRWAHAHNGPDILAALTAESVDEQARQLKTLSAGLLAKFERIRVAQTTLLIGLAVGMVAAGLSLIGR